MSSATAIRQKQNCFSTDRSYIWSIYLDQHVLLRQFLSFSKGTAQFFGVRSPTLI